MSTLIQRLTSAGSIKSTTLAKSTYFNVKDSVATDLPVLNIAFSGKLDGGFAPGLTILAGESKTFKTMLGLFCLKAYLTKYPDSVCLFYDNEFGTTPAYVENLGIEPDRIVHIPIHHVEELKFDIVKRLNEIKRGDKVFIFIDSLGGLPSKKEVTDTEEGNDTTDMTRAKAIRSLFRIVNPHLNTKDLPCMVINHVYNTLEKYSKTIIPGGTAVTFMANQIFVITKAQEKDGKEYVGNQFTINIHKSRTIREKSRLPFIVNFETGIKRFSGIFDLAVELGAINKVTAQSYSMPSVYGDTTMRRKEMEKKEHMIKLIADPEFNRLVTERFKLEGKVMNDDEDEEILVDEDGVILEDEDDE